MNHIVSSKAMKCLKKQEINMQNSRTLELYQLNADVSCDGTQETFYRTCNFK